MSQVTENIRFNVLRNALYHTARRMRFERLNRWFNFAVILLGAAAMGDILGTLGIPQIVAGASVAVIGAAQLAFDFGRAARDHQQLQRDYYNLLADIEAVPNPDEAQCALWYSQMIRIAGEEPPIMRAIDAKAYNDAIGAMEMPADQRLHVPVLHRLMQNYISFEGYSYEKVADLNAVAPS